MSEKMLFCFGDGKYAESGEGYQKHYRIFNKDVSKEVYNKAITRPSFELPIVKWIDKKDMTDDEKENYPVYKEMGGYLKTLSYQDAWKEGWLKASDEFKKWVKELPNFDAEIFEKITGIKWEDDSLKGQVVEVKVGGKSYTAIIQ